MTPRVKSKAADDEHDGTTAMTGSTGATSTKSAAPAQQQNEHAQKKSSATSASNNRSIHYYIPNYLRNLIQPYHGDFCFTPIFHPRLISQLMAEGFLPIATNAHGRGGHEYYLLPKLHKERSVIFLPDALHLSKSIRKKKAKRFSITVNQAFDRVVQDCQFQHGDRHCWLYPPLVDAFKQLHLHPEKYVAMVEQQHPTTVVPCSVQVYSVEVWNETTKELVAGELGYTVNSIYTSLTGFSREDSAGSVQLAALGQWLCIHQFELWDLGMDMEYKQGLGAHLMPRDEFVRLVHCARAQSKPIGTTTEHTWSLPVSAKRINCKELIDDAVEKLQRQQQKQGNPVSAGTSQNQHHDPQQLQQPQKVPAAHSATKHSSSASAPFKKQRAV